MHGTFYEDQGAHDCTHWGKSDLTKCLKPGCAQPEAPMTVPTGDPEVQCKAK